MNKKSRLLRAALILLLAVLTAVGTSGCMALALYVVSGITAAETGVCSTFYPHGTPAEGTVRIPVFLVEFPNAAFRPDRLSDDEVEQMLFDPDDAASMAAFERAASNGRLRVEGDVFSYTVRQDSTDYQDESGSFEKLAMEVLAALDGEIDYRDYDSDGDGYLDAFVLNIAQGDQDPYWFGCQTYWNENPDFAVDGVRPFNYIINDAQPDADGWSMDYYVSVLCHEFGHCLGLPDYYYLDLNAEETSDEADGLKGAAGLEMMDDMEGDYSQFSRLMLGYLDPESVQIYRGGEEEFLLTSARRGGGCLILPRDGMGSRAKLLWGEYFLVEYNTGDGNLSWYADEDFGVRIFHVNAETVRYDDGTRGFTYDDALYGSVDGRRVLRLVRDGEDYLTGGDVVDGDTPGFAWYDAEGCKTVDSGLILRFEWDEKGRGMYCIVTPTGK